MDKGMLVILSGPSGSGKDTILDELARHNEDVRISISLTTRPKRTWEVDGLHYYFVDQAYFKRKLKEDMVLEHAQYGPYYYGTPKAPVDDLLAQGKTVVLKIEVQGAREIRKKYPDAVSIFLMPPSMSVLEERLRLRESEDEEEIQRRLSIATQEIEQAMDYDYIIVNHIVSYAVSDIDSILRAERHRVCRVKSIISEVLKNA